MDSELKFGLFKQDKNSGRKFNRLPMDQGNREVFPVNANFQSPVGPSQFAPAQPQSIVPAYTTYNSPQESEESLDYREYLGIILHHRYWLFASVIIMVFFGFFTKINFDPQYSSTSKLRILSMNNIMDPWYGSDHVSENLITTHMENIQSKKFLAHVVKALDTTLSPSQLLGQFKVNRSKDANIINIKAVTSDPVFSVNLANKLSSTYEKYDLALKQKNFKEYESWIQQQMAIKLETLDSLEKDIQLFFEKNPNFYTNGKQGLVALQGLGEEITRVNMDLHQINRKIILIQAELNAADSQVIKEVTYDRPLQKDLLSMKLEMAKLSTRYGESHPKIADLRRKMGAVRKLIREDATKESNTTTMVNNPKFIELEAQLKNELLNRDLLNSRKNHLQTLQASSFKNLSIGPELELRLSQLTRSKQSTEKIYFMLQEKRQETRLKMSAMPREVFHMEPASLSRNPIPKKVIGFFMSIMIGLIIGSGICFLLEFLDTTIRKSKDLEGKYGLNLLGLIPKSAANPGPIKASSSDELMKPEFEPYRRLLANLHPVTPYGHNTCKTLLVTSALQGEGKTTTAAFLAVTSALKGERVLIIDADLRRHNLHNLFSISNEHGLSDYLTKDIQLNDITVQTSVPGLSLVPAGRNPLSLSQTPSKIKLQQLIAEARKKYDLVLFDSPPILQLTDTLMLAPLVSQTLVVFRSKKTPVKAGEEVLRQLTHIQANIAGGILNDVSRSFWDQYYYQYYKYEYKYG